MFRGLAYIHTAMSSVDLQAPTVHNMISWYEPAPPIMSAVQVRPGDAIRFRRMTVEEVGSCLSAWSQCSALHSPCVVAHAGITPRPTLLAMMRVLKSYQTLHSDALLVLQAYTQRFQVDRQVSLVNEVARGARSAAEAEAEMAAYKVRPHSVAWHDCVCIGLKHCSSSRRYNWQAQSSSLMYSSPILYTSLYTPAPSCRWMSPRARPPRRCCA